jgi:cobalt/nickel transport system permease protein
LQTFDRYTNQNTLVHRLDPRVKVMVTLLFIVSNAVLPDGSWLAFLFAWFLLAISSRLARISTTYLLKRSAIALPFAFAAVTVLFTIPGQTVASWHVAGRQLSLTDAGLVRFASILIRGWLSVQMAILLTAVTQFPDLMHALTHLRVPRILIGIIGFMYRYLFVLADEAMRLLRARAARSAQPVGGRRGRSAFWQARVAGNMVGQLFVRSLDRSDRVYNAMVARGYQGQLLTMNPHIMTKQDWMVGGTAVSVIVFIQLIGWLT